MRDGNQLTPSGPIGLDGSTTGDTIESMGKLDIINDLESGRCLDDLGCLTVTLPLSTLKKLRKESSAIGMSDSQFVARMVVLGFMDSYVIHGDIDIDLTPGPMFKLMPPINKIVRGRGSRSRKYAIRQVSKRKSALAKSVHLLMKNDLMESIKSYRNMD